MEPYYIVSFKQKQGDGVGGFIWDYTEYTYTYQSQEKAEEAIATDYWIRPKAVFRRDFRIERREIVKEYDF